MEKARPRKRHKITKNFASRKIREEEIIDEASAPIIKFLNTIIENAVLYNASDIHIEPERRNES